METKPKTNGKGANGTAPKNNTPVKKAEDIIKEQQQYFNGLTDLVNKRARFQDHKEAVEKLDFEQEEVEIFEHEYNAGGCIKLKDFKHHEYEIKNPKLVLEVKNFIVEKLNIHIKTFEEGIVAFAEMK
jgi:hypothetical protein